MYDIVGREENGNGDEAETMSVIVECSVPTEDFALGGVFQAIPTARIEFDRIVPTTGSVVPFFWVREDNGIEDPHGIADTLTTDEYIHSVEVLDAFEDRALFRAEWVPTTDGFVRTVIEHDAALVEAIGTSERWQFELRFLDPEGASAFQTACLTAGVSLDVRRVHTPAKPTLDGSELTPGQREAVVAAFESGFFEIPRRVTLVDLGAQLGISDQAVSERLRRAQTQLTRSVVENGTTSPGRP